MADGVVLKMKFDTMSGSKTWSFKYANPSATATIVKNLATAMIENGSILQYSPVRLADARLVVTSETVYSIDS